MFFRNLFLLVSLMLFLSVTFTGEPTRAQKTHNFKVHVSVTCEDEHTKSLIQSYIKRELRSLGDVLIVGNNDQYILNIVAVEPTYEATGRKIGGIAIGSVFFRKTLSGDYSYPDLRVCGDDTKDLEGICKSIVANIDTRHLEPVRELDQLLQLLQ